MNNGQVCWEDATSIGSMLASKSISPTEVLRAFLERITRFNPQLNAIVALDETGALRAARDSERRQLSGTRLGPLDGIPVTVKDNLFAAGFRATWGSRLFERYSPGIDDLAVSRVRAAGAVILGKTNTPEFALNNQTTNLVFGTTLNPWDPRLTPGGSSGGAAVSVAAALAPLAIGTDSGGSIRQPAGFTGIAGLKPSVGRVARAYGFPSLVADYQVIGLMARSLRDIVMLAKIASVPDARDRSSLAFVDREIELRSNFPRAKILVVTKFGGHSVDPHIRDAIESAAVTFSELGHDVERREEPFDLQVLYDLWKLLGDVGVARVVHNAAEPNPQLGDAIASAASRGSAVSAISYLSALDRLATFRTEIGLRWTGFDVLLAPISPSMPWPADPAEQLDDDPASAPHLSMFNKIANAAGYPAISIPGVPAPSGLPIGVQIVARYGEENLLLSLAREYEERKPWIDRRPLIS